VNPESEIEMDFSMGKVTKDCGKELDAFSSCIEGVQPWPAKCEPLQKKLLQCAEKRFLVCPFVPFLPKTLLHPPATQWRSRWHNRGSCKDGGEGYYHIQLFNWILSRPQK